MNQKSFITNQRVNPSFFNYVEVFLIWVQDFLVWWYLQIPYKLIQFLKRFILVIDDSFSFSIITHNFFSPWRKDRSIAGWFMGIATKVMYLPIIISFILIGSLIVCSFLIVWIIIPPFCIAFIFLGPILS